MESVVGLQWAYTNKRQSAYATPNPSGDITESHPFEGADFADHVPNMSDNAAQFGKGHEFATRNAILSWDVRFRRTFQATTKMLGWAFAFHCGKVTTSAAGGGFQHVMEYQDPGGAGYYGSGRQQPVTTVYERVYPSLIRVWPSCQVMAVEVTGQLNDWVRMALEIIGSGKKNDGTGFTFPVSVEGAGLLRHAGLLFQHGPSASLLDESCDIDSFRFRSEMAYDEVGGYCPGSGYQVSGDPNSGQVRSKLEFTRRAVLMEFVARAKSGSQIVSRLDNQSILKLLMTITGPSLGGGQFHQVIINIPQLQYRAIPINVAGDVITFAVSTVVFYDAGLDNPWEVTVKNEVSSYLVSS